jgi:hypothetical protein
MDVIAAAERWGFGRRSRVTGAANRALLSAVTTHDSHDADDGAECIANGVLIRDEPVKHTMLREPQFDPTDQGLAVRHDKFRIAVETVDCMSES